MKTFQITFAALTIFVLIFYGCKKDPLIPLIRTTEVTDITLVSAKSGGDVTDDGGAAITDRGICYGTELNPTLSDHVLTSGSGMGSFVSEIVGLVPGTTYYVRAYAVNKVGTAYGEQVTFSTTPVATATLVTNAVTDITLNSVKSGGNITSDGGGAITARGVCWGTSQNPTLSNSFSTDGSGSGTFQTNLTGLLPGTTYYVRSYATNSAGTAYGNEVSFTTLAVTVAVLTTTVVTDITRTSAKSGGVITSNGGAQITARGICWSTTENPTVANSTTLNASGDGTFISDLTGLTGATTYYVRAYATNSAGTGYGNQVTFTTLMPDLPDMVDIEGNVYKTVKIGDQIWMAENLKTTKFNNNVPIDNVPDATTWISLTTPAYGWYDNNIANKDIYGALYNNFAVGTGNLCPVGWHEPTEAEFGTLEKTLGMTQAEVDTWGWRGLNQGTMLKSTSGWGSGSGTNSSGFNVLPGGYRQWALGSYYGIGTITYLWSATDDAANLNPNKAWYRRFDAAESRVYKATTDKQGGKYVRCVKD